MGSVFFGGGKIGMEKPLGLPSGYTKLAYIQSSGTQYINTGVYPTEKTAIEFKASSEFYAAVTSSAARYGIYLVPTGRIDMAFGTTGYKGSVLTGLSEPTTVRMENGKIAANGSEYSFTTQSAFTISTQLPLFAQNTTLVSGVLYYCKIYDNGTLIRDFIPCADNNGTVGLYDLVNKQFYGNAGSGTFTGSEVA